MSNGNMQRWRSGTETSTDLVASWLQPQTERALPGFLFNAMARRQRAKTLEIFHRLGSAVIGAGIPNASKRTGAFACEGTLRKGGLWFRGYVAELPGQLAGNDICPPIERRHEVSIMIYDTIAGSPLPGAVYTSRHDGLSAWAPRGEVVSAPITTDGIVERGTWVPQRLRDFPPLDCLLSQLQWGDVVQIMPPYRDPNGPLYT